MPGAALALGVHHSHPGLVPGAHVMVRKSLRGQGTAVEGGFVDLLAEVEDGARQKGKTLDAWPRCADELCAQVPRTARLCHCDGAAAAPARRLAPARLWTRYSRL